MNDPDLGRIVMGFLAIVISITFHEFAHAIVADKLGDPTPRRHGRISLNPMVLWRAYPVGSLIAPLIGAYSGFLVGWAATPVNPSLVHRKHTVRKANFLISVAGPVSNMLLGLVSIGLVVALFPLTSSADSFFLPLFDLAQSLVLANTILAMFNLIPIPPLDGFTVLSSALPARWGKTLQVLQQYSFLIFLLIIFKGSVIFGPLIQGVFGFTGWLLRVVYG